ncbi:MULTISPECIES: type II glyceraldehyde-3-phosphate dehydrogenase [Acidiplasma]|jgi:glyceraldehyde-3-phosphate dehydrogenase (NAD(P))|uniref:Glyceraldehyde-3-phosphate dehydrogenase n=2 Tax=Acidiplasma TaxID=507753 RepID=A0A0Q0RS69_9ARCH|nr:MULTISPECIES: type II glyceraldehyde-3-phosphate dehydrogenase [Acidiplasma]KJE49364.1 glyceraldehyde-3-phosphate dehydrogenase [Acidiplasma sp. MBA-1]KQB34487.1 glyceraldehyde-3-phosphate dehydrogenase [Acidiplasma aeolicum]KQB35229.1 glyceraldehyde-3-phosphate dehydrogenase [Acidiplasma cupricumulans]WMT54694.1 MAG: type II glyceraldehyde-3-phosphate dehydrogenase [Acidiplasma sp.]
MIGVGINGYGTIGRRVAHAVSAQDDMFVTGIVKNSPDYVAKEASKYFNVYVPSEDKIPEFEENGIRVKGTLDDLCSDSDIIVDGTPEGMGERNIKKYREYNIKAILEGGEKASAVETSFNAYSSFDDALNKNYVRVVSCNTTALARSLYPIHSSYKIKNVNAVILRRATDPNDSKKGPINAMEPSMQYPSHHAPDLQTVIKGINILTTAVKIPTTLMHIHVVDVDLEDNLKEDDIIDIWKNYGRLLLLNSSDGLKSTAQIMDLARELSRNRSDLYEIAIWRDSIKINNNKLHYIQAVHQESDVIPENVDAIRAMFNLLGKDESIRKTDSSLKIKGGIF